MIFDHDWWRGGAFDRQLCNAREACTRNRFPDTPADGPAPESPAARFMADLETRTVVYVRDGFSYEIKRLIDMSTTAYLTIECMPSDPVFRVGAFVLSVPYEEICRVETFAVHTSERPEESPAIKGFGGGRVPTGGRADDRPTRPDSRDAEAEVDADDEDA